MDDDWLTVEAFAGLPQVGVAPQTVYNWRAQGRAPRAHKIGRRLLFRRADVDRWLDAHAEPEPRSA
jgi:excisionase family DNA binding protein